MQLGTPLYPGHLHLFLQRLKKPIKHMGSANITPLQSVEIIQIIKNEYDDFYSTHEQNEKNNEEFKKKILTKYDNTLVKLSNEEKQQDEEEEEHHENKVPTSKPGSPHTSSSTRTLTKSSSLTTPTMSVVNSMNVGKRPAQKYQGGSKSMEARPKLATRLRSFDEAPPSKAKNSKDQTSMESHNETDSWDSVKAQPACLLCGMVFTSPDKLNTHTKYSTIHASNLKRLEDAKFAAAAEAAKSPSPRKLIRPKLTPSGEPPVPYRVLYTGSKFFWRSKHNIDFHIYHHANPSILEIIGYDSATQTELPRLYLDETLVSFSIPQNEILSRVKINKDAQTKYLNVLENTKLVQPVPSKVASPVVTTTGPSDAPAATASLKHASSFTSLLDTMNAKDQVEDRNELTESVPTEELDVLFYDEEKRLLVVSRLMSKLQYQKVIGSPVTTARNNPSGTPLLVHYELSFMDPQLQAAILPGKPNNITSVMISRRRHSTQAEISESFRTLNTMQVELQEITAKAEKMSQLIRQSIELFTKRQSFNSPSKYASPRTTGKAGTASPGTSESLKKKEICDRWRYAIHKVVLRNALDQTVEMLKGRERGREHGNMIFH